MQFTMCLEYLINSKHASNLRAHMNITSKKQAEDQSNSSEANIFFPYPATELCFLAALWCPKDLQLPHPSRQWFGNPKYDGLDALTVSPLVAAKTTQRALLKKTSRVLGLFVTIWSCLVKKRWLSLFHIYWFTTTSTTNKAYEIP